MKNIKKIKLKGPALVWILSALALIPLAITLLTHLITLQSFTGTFIWAFTHMGAVLLEYLVLLFSSALIYAAVRKLCVAFALPGGLLTVFTLISHYKTVINGTPLLLRDLTLASQFSEIFGFALPQITLSLHTAAALVLFLLVFAVLLFLDLPLEKVKLLRPIMAAAAAAGILVFLFTPLLPSLAVRLDDGTLSEEERIKEHGAALGIYCTYAQNQKDVAAFASASFDELISQVGSLEITKKDVEETPTVIFLMSESFFDVTKLPDVEFSEDPIPVFRSLSEKHTSGDFISNTYCGGTGYVEMEVLTGICSNLLKESETLTSLSPNSVYRGIPTIADVFSKYGYRTSFLHSYNSNLYNRKAIYSAFGFDDILFEDSFSPDVEMKGGYISDMALSEKIISMYEEKGDDPMFMFALSMENHQPYTSDKFSDEGPITVKSELLTQDELALLDAYVNGLHDADAALGRLVEYFEEMDEPVMIVFFGDHLPNLGINDEETVYSRLGYSSTAVTTDWKPDELAKMLSTDYVIWSNYEESVCEDRKESSNMLGLTVLKRIGFGLDNYYAWLDKYVAPSLLIYRPRLYVDKKGNAYSSVPDEYKAVMDNYSLAVYDIVYGGGNVFKIFREKETK